MLLVYSSNNWKTDFGRRYMYIIHLRYIVIKLIRFIVPPRRRYFTTLYFPQLRSFWEGICVSHWPVWWTPICYLLPTSEQRVSGESSQVPTRSSNASATLENNQSIDHSGRNQTSLVGGWTNLFAKNMLVKMGSSSPNKGENKNILETTI